MARTKGTFNISANIEVNASAPLDARERVPQKSDLTASGTFPYFYEGMQVYVVSEQKRYTLKGSDPTVLANWVEDNLGADKADLVDGKVPANQLPSYVDDVIEGYYKAADGKFYEESTYVTEIVGERGKIYIDLGTNPSDTYRWTGSEFAKVASGGACNESIAFADFNLLPSSEQNNGTAYYVYDKPSGPAVYKSGTWFDKTAGDGIDINNGAISVDGMPSTDMEEIIDPLPSVMSRRMKYSTEEQIVGEWVDGKPIYQKTISIPETTFTLNENILIPHSISNLDTVLFFIGELRQSNSNGRRAVPNSNFYVGCGNTNIVLVSTEETLTDYFGHMILQYTKTTD